MAAHDDFPAELDRAYKRIEELETEAKEMERNLKNYMNIAWWRTYNAALTGLSMRRDLDVAQTHDAATYAAELAHGKRR